MSETRLSELPDPKYRIGQSVWFGSTDTAVEALPCPDCLGSRKWSVVTPAGDALETPCQRCGGSRWQSGIGDLPRPERRIHVPRARRLTIGSVRIDTASSRGPVEYMCEETGVGSGSLYEESRLFATEDDALSSASGEVAALNAKEASGEAYQRTTKLSGLTVKDAILEDARSSIWSAWWSYRRLREDVDKWTGEDGGETADERLAELRRELEFDDRHREQPPVGQMLADLAPLVAGIPAAADLVEKLANPARAALLKARSTEVPSGGSSNG